jgi:hypothetical protein
VGLNAVIVVHETATPDVRRLVALCDEHERILKQASWAQVDEIVGFSSVMECEACPLISHPTLLGQPAHGDSAAPGIRHLRPLPTSA